MIKADNNRLQIMTKIVDCDLGLKDDNIFENFLLDFIPLVGSSQPNHMVKD